MSESKQYRLRYVMHEPSEDTEDMYLAEALDIPGCRAWGETQEQACEYLRDVAAGFIELYVERGEALPVGSTTSRLGLAASSSRNLRRFEPHPGPSWLLSDPSQC